MKQIIKTLMLVFCIVLIAGCAGNTTPAQETTSNQDSDMQTEETMKTAVIETSKGKIVAELYTKEAPITTANFIGLVNSGFYTGLTFHRYEPGFVIQGGDPKGDGTGGSPNKIKLEINPKLTHVQGALAMARTQVPDSASSQFYIALDAAHFLDGSYAVFGKVTEGMDNALKLRAGDKISSITIQ
jgi:peptidyl-prolyl cis-trans isomerase B (cyclophilin B)